MSTEISDEERLLEFLYAAPVGLVEIALDGEISMINPYAMKHLFPVAGARDSGNLFTIFERCGPELRNLVDDFEAERGTVCEGHRIAVDLGPAQHGVNPKVLSCTLVKLNPTRAIACISDVSLQVSQERRLKEAETWFASLVHDVRDYAVLSITPSGAVESANASWEKQTGIPIGDILGSKLSELFPASLKDGGLIMAEQLHVASRDGWYLEEGWHYRGDGSKYWSQRLLAARTCPQGKLTGYTLVLRDVMRDGSAASDLRRLLTQDHLTGAANRVQFNKVLEGEQVAWRQHGKPLALVMVDIDHFKQVNDAYGHPAGDAVLSHFAKTVADRLRPTDLLARLGGEEFAILLPATTLTEATALAETLRSTIAEMVVEIPRGSIRVTASLGCASLDVTADLLNDADAALYIAKREGRNCVRTSENTAAAA